MKCSKDVVVLRNLVEREWFSSFLLHLILNLIKFEFKTWERKICHSLVGCSPLFQQMKDDKLL